LYPRALLPIGLQSAIPLPLSRTFSVWCLLLYLYVFCSFVSYPVFSGCPFILLPFYPPFVCFLRIQAPLVSLVAPPDCLCNFCLVYIGGFLYFCLICIWLSLTLLCFQFCCHRYKSVTGCLPHSLMKSLY